MIRNYFIFLVKLSLLGSSLLNANVACFDRLHDPVFEGRLKKSVVKVLSYKPFNNEGVVIKDTSGELFAPKGTGFCVDSEAGLFVTNRHVCSQEAWGEIEILSFRGEAYPAQLVYQDPLYDIAVLKIKQSLKKDPIQNLFEALDLETDIHEQVANMHYLANMNLHWVCSTRTLEQDALDTASHYEQGLYQNGYTDCDFLFLRNQFYPNGLYHSTYWQLCFSAKTIRGDSGSPVFNSQKKVVGMIQSGSSHPNEAQETQAVPALYIKEALRKFKEKSPPEGLTQEQALGLLHKTSYEGRMQVEMGSFVNPSDRSTLFFSFDKNNTSIERFRYTLDAQGNVSLEWDPEE